MTMVAFATVLLLSLDASTGFVVVNPRVVSRSPTRRGGFFPHPSPPPRRSLSLSSSSVVDLVVNEPIVRDSLCSIASAAGAIAWLKIWTTLASSGSMDSRLSRKIIHCGSAPLFLLVWPFFSSSPEARLVAAVVPALNMAKLAFAAKGTDAESTRLITAVSRSGEAKEVLGGPLLYCAVLLLATLFGWRTSVAAVVAICQMAVGDGLADIVGRRYGKQYKWPFAPNKYSHIFFLFNRGDTLFRRSYAGSVAFVVGATLASAGIIQWFELCGCLTPLVDGATLLLYLFAISTACALVELIPVADDNLSVPLVGALLAYNFL